MPPDTGFDGYEVSSEGGSDHCPVRPLPQRSHVPVEGPDYDFDGQGAKSMLVHRVVLMALGGRCPPGSDSWAS